MSRIHILPDHLVSQIAAGEVVERPASVLKELIENSLDADAGRLEIDLEHGGKRRIRLVDDGHGMDRDDALLAFDRHATSKISSFEDLEAVSSFGFRGEALASIAAVAKVDLTTATESGEGFRVRIEGGRVRKAEPVGAPRGTSVEVASLFYNVPARRRFLKTPRTELARSTEVVQAYALARPAVGLTARHGGRTLLEVGPGSDDEEGLSRRLLDLFGEELVDASTPFAAEPAPGLRLWGRVGDPSTARSRRRFSFVNRRLVRDRAVLANFYRAVRDEWHSDDFPALFLFIDLPGSEVDVNVHPQKAEVRFRDQRILRRIYDTLREA
ncbi:MAG: DNA mismatch repair endonuclease MutL, partial [Thermoanaerobaculia bacterium]|nr:DNA mismatch repair endonuclease MutL [Thermoanaerobaculia bacterium]